MPDDLYERDVLIWAEQQADLLRRLSLGERVNAQIDWPHVIEELHDVGLSELNAVRSLLRQALVHLLKVHGWPNGPVAHWRDETLGFLIDAHARWLPSMRQRVECDQIYARALKQVRLASIDGRRPGPLPDSCPWTIDMLLDPDVDPAALLAAVSAGTPGS